VVGVVFVFEEKRLGGGPAGVLGGRGGVDAPWLDTAVASALDAEGKRCAAKLIGERTAEMPALDIIGELCGRGPGASEPIRMLLDVALSDKLFPGSFQFGVLREVEAGGVRHFSAGLALKLAEGAIAWRDVLPG
jgi:hypothetical protein